MSANIRRKVQLIGFTSGIVPALLTLLFLTLTPKLILYAAPMQVYHSTVAQTGSITGRVTAEDSGAPLSSIEVVAFPREVAGEQQLVSASTDAAGHYALPDLQAGTYKVCFGPFRIDERYLSECYDNQPLEAATEQLVTVTAGEVLPNINAVLTLGGMIQGRVTSDLTGEPLPNISVGATRIEAFYHRNTHTDANGVYTITTLPTGDYRVQFNSGGIGGNQIYAWEYFDNQASEEMSNPVSVTAGVTTSGIDADLTFILNITGSIGYEGGDEPESALDIRVYDATGAEVQYHLAANSAYSITALPPGAYRLRFGMHEFINEYYSNSPTFEGATWITVTPNKVISNVNVSLRARPGSELTLATASTRPNAILAARTDGFHPLYTLDGGQTWHTFATKPVEMFQDVRHLAVAPKDDEAQPVRFLVARNDYTAPPHPGLFRTADGGESWAGFAPSLHPSCDGGQVSTLETLVASAADPQRLYFVDRCPMSIGGIEPVYVWYWTLYASHDGGVNWQAETLPLVENGAMHGVFHGDSLQPSSLEPLRLYANLKIDAHTNVWRRSDDGGQSWITETFTAAALALDWTDASKLYRVVDHGESNALRYTGKRSNNTGGSWDDWAQQPCRSSFQQLITLPAADTLLILCNQGLLRSENGGDSWELLTSDSGGRLSVHYGDRGLVLWVRGAALLGSRDQGTTWQDLGGWQDAYLPSVHRP